jgi:diaminopropionate ammonia-lyase
LLRYASLLLNPRQAGVGGMAAAIAGHIRDHWKEQPTIVVVEPDAAPCLITSIRAGELTHAAGHVSNMGRLDCKDASLIAFEALQQDADFLLTISDTEANAAVDHLSATGIESSPSGVEGIAAMMAANSAVMDEFGLSPDSRCVAIISEGAA